MAKRKEEKFHEHEQEEELEVSLTSKEVERRSHDLAKVVHAISKVEEEKKAMSAEYAGRLKKLRAGENRLATAVTSRKEFRYTTVIHRRDFETNRYQKTRVDTSAVILDRPLLEEEKQMPLG